MLIDILNNESCTVSVVFPVAFIIKPKTTLKKAKNNHSFNHKSERTDAASASLYSYPRDSNPRAAYKKILKKYILF